MNKKFTLIIILLCLSFLLNLYFWFFIINKWSKTYSTAFKCILNLKNLNPNLSPALVDYGQVLDCFVNTAATHVPTPNLENNPTLISLPTQILTLPPSHSNVNVGAFQKCIDGAKVDYSNSWTSICGAYGIKGTNCTVPSSLITDRVNAQFYREVEICKDVYK